MANPYSVSGLFAQKFAQMFGPTGVSDTPEAGTVPEAYSEPFGEEAPTSEALPEDPPTGIDPQEVQDEVALGTDTTTPAALTPAAPVAPTAEGSYSEGAVPAPTEEPTDPTAAPATSDQWEEIWRKEYNVEAKDIIGKDTYDKLKKLADENLTPGQIIGIMGVLATNPAMGMKMIESKEARKSDAIHALATLEQTAAGVRKTGMTEIARTKRWESRIAERERGLTSKAESAERLERGKYAQTVLGAVREEGLPPGLVGPPTEAQLNDPKKFWEEWYPATNEAIAGHVGKQKILGWLYNKDGPAWLANQVAIDPAAGVENFLEASGNFSTKEIQDLKQTGILQEFSNAALAQRKENTAYTSNLESKTNVNDAMVGKLNQQVDYFKARVAQMGSLTPKERYGLLTDIAQQKRLAQEKMVNFSMSANWYSQLGIKEKNRDYSTMIESYAKGFEGMSSVVDSLGEIEQQVRNEMVHETMTVSDALPIADLEAMQNTMSQYSGQFQSPDEVYALVYSEEEPSDPAMLEARTFYYVNLLTSINQYSNLHPNDIVSLLDVAGQSIIDAYAGKNVTIPPTAAPMAGQQLRQGP